MNRYSRAGFVLGVALLAVACSTGTPAGVQTTVTSGRGTADASERIVELPAGERLAATYRLFEEDPPATRLVAELGDALDAEASSPTPGLGRTWFSASEELLQAYATGMGVPGAIPGLRARLNEATPAARPWYVITLGYAGDEEIDSEIVSLLRSRPDPAIAIHLINLAGLHGIPDSVPALENYLADEFQVQKVDVPGSPVSYPLRDEAAGALRRLGYTVYALPDRPGEYEVFDK